MNNEMSPTKKKKSDSSTIDKSPNKSKNKSPSKQLKERGSVNNVIESPNSKFKKRKIVWSKMLVDYISVESFKKYNLLNTHDDPNYSKEKVKCKCSIF